VSEYRDDRAALRERIAELERELEKARKEAQRPQRKLSGTVTPGDRLLQYWFILVSFAVAFGLFFGSRCSRDAPVAATDPPEPPSPTLSPVTEPPTAERPPVWELSTTCRCPPGEGRPGFVLAYAARDSINGGFSVAHFVDWALRFDAPTTASRREVPLSADDVRTVPGERLLGGSAELMFACLPDRVVFALGRRVTAWSTDDGRELWTSALPADVGATEIAKVKVECQRLEVDTKLRIKFPHSRGATRLEGVDGSEVR